MYLYNHHPPAQVSGWKIHCFLLGAHSSCWEKSLSLRSLSQDQVCVHSSLGPGAWVCSELCTSLCPDYDMRTKPKQRHVTLLLLFNVSLETEAKSTSETAHVMSRQQLSCLNTLRLLLNWMNKFKTGFKMSWNYVDREIFIVCSEIITQWTRG